MIALPFLLDNNLASDSSFAILSLIVFRRTICSWFKLIVRSFSEMKTSDSSKSLEMSLEFKALSKTRAFKIVPANKWLPLGGSCLMPKAMMEPLAGNTANPLL